MDAVSEQIHKIVKQHNDEGKEICFTDLVDDYDIAAPPTVQKRVIELIEDGKLVPVHVQTNHGTKKLLYATGSLSLRNDVIAHYQEERKIHQLKRIADILESFDLSGKYTAPEPSSRRRLPDGRCQTRLRED